MGKRTHGETGTRLHRIWCDMRERCRDGKPGHEKWGGRGITVCNEWNDFSVFKSWSLDNGYRDDLTIDRIDNNGNYEPSNCRWVSYKEQANNTRRNRLVTINGDTHTVSEWCDILDTVTYTSVYARMRRYGWTIEKALSTPPQRYIPLEPEVANVIRNKQRIPVTASNSYETLRFDSGLEVEKQGFNRKMAMNAARGNAKCKSNRHFYKGYIWNIDFKRKEEMDIELEKMMKQWGIKHG